MNDNDASLQPRRERCAEGFHVPCKIAVRVDEREAGAIGFLRELLHHQRHDGRFAGAGIAGNLDTSGALIEKHIEIENCRGIEPCAFSLHGKSHSEIRPGGRRRFLLAEVFERLAEACLFSFHQLLAGVVVQSRNGSQCFQSALVFPL